MPVLKEVIFSDKQVLELVKQLDFDKKMDLIKGNSSLAPFLRKLLLVNC